MAVPWATCATSSPFRLLGCLLFDCTCTLLPSTEWHSRKRVTTLPVFECCPTRCSPLQSCHQQQHPAWIPWRQQCPRRHRVPLHPQTLGHRPQLQASPCRPNLRVCMPPSLKGHRQCLVQHRSVLQSRSKRPSPATQRFQVRGCSRSTTALKLLPLGSLRQKKKRRITQTMLRLEHDRMRCQRRFLQHRGHCHFTSLQ